MINRRRFLLAMGGLAAMPLLPFKRVLAAAAASRWPLPPQPARKPAKVGRYGHHRIDDYAWLRPKDWQAVLREPATLDVDIKTVVEAENAYVEAMTAPAAALHASLSTRIAELQAIGAATLELRSGDFFYSTRQQAGSEYPVYLRQAVDGGKEQVLLDPAVEARGSAYYALHWDGPVRSGDGRLFGWTEDRTGSGQFTLRVRDIASGKDLLSIDQAHGSFAFSPDGRYLYWVGRDELGRAATVYRREVASDKDTLIHKEADPALFISLRTTASGRYLVIRLFNSALSEVHLLPLRTPEAKPQLVEARTPGLNYDIDDWGGQLVVLTDADGAEDFKLMRAREDALGRAHWKPWVDHVPGRLITALHPFADRLVREEWHDANPRLVVMHPDGSEHEMAFDEPAYALRVPPAQDWKARELVFGLQTPNRPEAACSLDLASGKMQRAEPATGAFKSSRYEVRRLFARAPDGEQIPITLLHRRGAPQDGSTPLLLTGYGSYGASVEARFDPSAIALVDQGWNYAIAHVRGGSEKGSRWWRSVLKHGKSTTFTDFIACAEYLIAQRHTAPRRIVARGMSAGGLLVSAVYVKRPDLWAGVIAQVPFVDVLNTMEQFDSHPLGTGALPIWGDPRIPEDHASMASWSPYEQLKPAAYPALLATGSVADERVGFYEPLKFAIKARALTTAHHPIMVRTELSGGHTGASGAKAHREQEALLLGFAIWAADDRWGKVPQRPEDTSPEDD